MKLGFTDNMNNGKLLLFKEEGQFDQYHFGRDFANKYFTIVWNRGENQMATIDNQDHEFKTHSLLTLLFSQTFSFEKPADVVAWQFNREFYCIVDNDTEVSCTGFLFATTEHLFIHLEESNQRKLDLLLQVFIEEFKTKDAIQHEILIVLLKRLIILITGLAKVEYVPAKKLQDDKFHIIRKFSFLVELNFRSQHTVSYYAGELCKSPKTLSNLFAIYNQKTPSQIIQERILFEARRLLSFTDKPVNEISYELGFEDAAHFSKFFKKWSKESPLNFRNSSAIKKGKYVQIIGKSAQ